MTQVVHHHCAHSATCSGHAHQASSHVPDNADTARLGWALAVIAAFAIVELIGGVISNSLALIADSAHMVTDAVAIGIALGARILARAPKTASHPYGKTRIQVLAAFVNGLALFVLIGFLAVESFQRMASPESIRVGTMLIIAIVGLGANAVAFAILHAGDRQDINMRGAVLHVIGDMLGSLAAIVSAIMIALTGLFLFDPLVTLVVCALVGRAAWSLTKESAHVLLQGAPPGLDINAVSTSLRKAVPSIKEIHDLKVWSLTPGETQLTLHARLQPSADSNAALKIAKTHLADAYGISSSIIQIEITELTAAADSGLTACPDHSVRPFEDHPDATAAPVH